MADFSHIDDHGDVRMVDVSSKPGTMRTARASGYIAMKPETLRRIEKHDVPKGNVFTTARIAGIQAAKRTADLIPLCHQLNLSWIGIDFALENNRIRIEATVRTREATGVEMEALTAVMTALLTIYDMCKAVDTSMTIGGVSLEEKKGGKGSPDAGYRPRTAILVVSDSISAGRGTDRSGEILKKGFEDAGCSVDSFRIVADEEADIEAVVKEWVQDGVELVVTSGGTGLGPRDITVDTLLPLFDRRLGGVEQALFDWGQGKKRTAMLSRLAAGTIGSAIVVCLPGSTGAALDAVEVLVPDLFHAFEMIQGGGHG